MATSTKSGTPLIIFCICVILLALETVLFYGKISEAREEREAMKKIAQEQEVKLEALENEAEYLKMYINRMLKDPDFADMEMRRRLGYTQEGEVIIRESDSGASRSSVR